MLKALRHPYSRWILAAVSAYCGLLLLYCLAVSFLGAQRVREDKSFALQHVLQLSRPLVKDGRSRELQRYLRDAVSAGLIDGWELDDTQGKPARGGTLPGRLPVLVDPVSEKEGWAWGKAESAQLSLRLGSGVGFLSRFGAAASTVWQRLPFDLSLLALAALAALHSWKRLRRQAARNRPERLSRARRGRRGKQDPAGRAPQREQGDFEGVVGRSVLQLPAQEGPAVLARLDDFLAAAVALLARYRGRMQVVHGHELLFYFCEGSAGEQSLLSLAAARDLAALAERSGLGLGTALALGRVHGGQLATGFVLVGEPMSDTARYLQSMRTGRELLVNSALAAAAGKPAPAKRQPDGLLLGLEAEDFRQILDSCHRGAASVLACHRSDAALAAVLQELESAEWEREAYVSTVSELRRVPSRRCGPEVCEAYRRLLGAEILRRDSYRLSSVLALAPELLQRGSIDKGLEKLFLQSITVKDRRVRANAVELFTRFFPEREMPELRPLIRDEDNRVSANALVKAACERFDEKVIARIEERVRCGSVAHVASALHAMGEIAHYYRVHDPLFLGTKVSFLRIFESIPAFASHPNSMIRRQALLAAHKLQSQPLDGRLRELFLLSNDPELLGLFASVYGWRKERLEAAA